MDWNDLEWITLSQLPDNLYFMRQTFTELYNEVDGGGGSIHNSFHTDMFAMRRRLEDHLGKDPTGIVLCYVCFPLPFPPDCFAVTCRCARSR